MALRGYLAEVKIQSTPVAFTEEATSTSDNQTYTITDTGKNIWSYDSTIVVYDDGVETTEEYTVSKLTGSVTFDSVDAGRVITVSGEYTVPTTVATAKDYTFNATADMHDNTAFQSAYRTFQPVLVTGTADLGRFYVADSTFQGMISTPEVKIIEYYPASDGDPFRFFAVMNSNSISASVDGLIEETVSFNITTEVEV
jgi:hypothetical protein